MKSIKEFFKETWKFWTIILVYPALFGLSIMYSYWYMFVGSIIMGFMISSKSENQEAAGALIIFSIIIGVLFTIGFNILFVEHTKTEQRVQHQIKIIEDGNIVLDDFTVIKDQKLYYECKYKQCTSLSEIITTDSVGSYNDIFEYTTTHVYEVN